MAETEDDADLLRFARNVIAEEAAAVGRMAEAVDDSFVKAVKLVLDCRGAVVTSGVGKAGHVARKLSATLASTGTPSHFLSPGDAVHGDLGSVREPATFCCCCPPAARARKSCGCWASSADSATR